MSRKRFQNLKKKTLLSSEQNENLRTTFIVTKQIVVSFLNYSIPSLIKIKKQIFRVRNSKGGLPFLKINRIYTMSREH